MSLDITFKSRKNIICPHCGRIAGIEDVHCEDSGGRNWYPILEQLGYYVPYDKRNEENDWYGKDMVLTEEQAMKVYYFVRKNPELYNAHSVRALISSAMLDQNMIVINADW